MNIIETLNRVKEDLITLMSNNFKLKMNKVNPSGAGSLSMNRADSSNVGEYSTTIGKDNTASGDYASANGYQTVAKGKYSSTEGVGTIASKSLERVIGSYNVENNTEDEFLLIVGNGSDDANRSNAYTLTKEGNGWYAGSLVVVGDILTMGQLDAINVSAERISSMSSVEATTNFKIGPGLITYDAENERIVISFE